MSLHNIFQPLRNLFSVILGGTPATLTNPGIQVTSSVDNYTQISIQNKSATANSSADIIAYPDNISGDLTWFADMWITSSTFSQAAYAITSPNDAYLFGSAPSGASMKGNLVICTDSTGSNNEIIFGTNWFNSTANERMRIKKAGQVNFAPIASDPSGAVKGDMYFNGTTNKLKVYNGTTWETVTSV